MNARLFLAGFVFVSVLAAGLLAEESRTPAPPSTPVTRQEVWQAVMADLHEQRISDAQLPAIEDLDLPVALPALAGRKLRVASACWDEGPAHTQFRLECAEPGQCLPFLAYVHARIEGTGASTGACPPKSESRPPPEVPLKAVAKPTVHPGDRATAVFLSARLRISANVTCLERGREGEIIRVRGEDGQVFRARISGPAQLEALPQ